LSQEKAHYPIYINGVKETNHADYYDLLNPYDLYIIGKVPLGSPKDMERAIQSSHNAFAHTKKQPAHERASVLSRTADLLTERFEEFAQLISLEAAKPIKAARVEVSRSIQTFRFAAEEAKRMTGETVPMEAAIGGEGKIAFTLREPIGVIGAITPFNFPLNLVAHKVAPAIASGNTIVLKPAEQTPLTSLRLAELMSEAGLVDGALNVVTGDGPSLGHVLNTHPLIKKVSFTGSPEVGKIIQSKAGFKKLTLELGSNAALLIDKNVSIPEVVTKAVSGGFGFAGQVCIHTQRVYVHKDIYQDFVREFVERTEKLVLGHPQNEMTDLSAVINPKSKKRILDWIDEAVSNGATLQTGGDVIGQAIKPTILTDVSETDKLVCQEVFGPVVIVNPIESIEEGVELTNNSRYGLNAGVFTKDLDTAFNAAKNLEVGQVLINEMPTFRVDHMPYGGIKDSGVGKEGIRYAIQEMTEEKLIVVHITS
jgi:acyl-CoA reductase-like NAD-dependent aldehyde dehydrogenase